VVAAESSNSPVRDEAEIVATIEAFNLGVALYTAAARALLAPHDGYECKEPEPGKLTLAFRHGVGPRPPGVRRRGRAAAPAGGAPPAPHIALFKRAPCRTALMAGLCAQRAL
jgi:hypothetical protein